MSEAISVLGGLDILVNNAGLEITSLFVDIDPGDVRRMLDVNLLGTTLGIKHAFLAMRPGGPAGAGGYQPPSEACLRLGGQYPTLDLQPLPREQSGATGEGVERVLDALIDKLGLAAAEQQEQDEGSWSPL